MGFPDVTTVKGPLLELGEISLKKTAEYDRIRDDIEKLSQAFSPGAIGSEADLSKAIRQTERLRELAKEIQNSIISVESEITRISDQASQYQTSLLSPLNSIIDARSHEKARYVQERERIRQAEEEAQKQRQKVSEEVSQRQNAILLLRSEIAMARQVADNSERSAEIETAKEIRLGLVRFNALDTSPGSFQNPRKDAIEVRDLVAKALQNEQKRRG